MSELNLLELKVTKSVVGVLETNIEQLENYVDEKLKEYNPQQYIGDSDAAKRDRAELNNAKKMLANARINLMKELMKPYETFERRCKTLEKKIDNASGLLDEIVKEKENEEKEKKRHRCIEIWETKKFNLFPIDRVFNPKWLNKTTKEIDIEKEIDYIIDKAYKDLKAIERFEDAETLKAHYLISLDIAETLKYGETLKQNREIAEKEKEERAEREHNTQIEKQKKEVIEEALELARSSDVQDLVNRSMGIQEIVPRVNEYVITIQATEEQLLELKGKMNSIGIEYRCEELNF